MKIDTFYAASHATHFAKVYTSSDDRVLLGRNQSYDALTLLKFSGLLASTLDTITVTSVSLQLHAVYHFGDSLGALAFSVYRAITAWDTVSYDSLSLQPNAYYDPTVVAGFSPAAVDDTSSIQCQIDTAVAKNWFTPLGSLSNYGIVLKASNISAVKGFASFNHSITAYRPALIFTYLKNGVSGTFTVNTGSSRYVANIPQPSLVTNPDLMYVQAGVAYRGQLYFNLQSLPKAALILRADLELTMNGSGSRVNSFTADSVDCFYINPDSTATTFGFSSQKFADNAGNAIYRIPVRDYVRIWAASSTLQSLQFGAKNETNSLDLFAFYGTLSAANVRPRLIITSTYVIQ